MNMIWNSHIGTAVAAAVFSLLAVLFYRSGLIYGATCTGVCVGSGISLFIFGMLEKPYDAPDFGTTGGFIRAFLGGLLLSIAFRLALRFFALYGARR